MTLSGRVSDEQAAMDVMEPWTIKSCARHTRLRVVRLAQLEGVTVGRWLERRVDEWEADGSPAPVPTNGHAHDLTMLVTQQKQMLDEMADFRDQLTALTAICMRVEASVGSLTVEVRAMHSRHDRLARRVTDLEAAQP